MIEEDGGWYRQGVPIRDSAEILRENSELLNDNKDLREIHE